VEFRDGPAAVTGDKDCMTHCGCNIHGKGQSEGDPEVRRPACNAMLFSHGKGAASDLGEKQGYPGSYFIGPGFF